MRPEKNDDRSSTTAKMRERCQLETLNYLYASLPQYNTTRIMPTKQHVAALRAVPDDPQHPLFHFRRYWRELAEVGRCWARVRDERGGAGGYLWSVVTKRLRKQSLNPHTAGDQKAVLMGVLDEGFADRRKRERFVRDWKEKRLF
jgi:hypothetical protein